MADRIRIKTWDDNKVHFDFKVNDYTLCGLETSGDPSLGISLPVRTNRKVNCPDCISRVEFCKTIKLSEWVKE